VDIDLLVVGGGASGICAGIQAARMGVKTIVVEESSMVGGMFLAAGVTAFDGNKHAVGGGLFGEFRRKLEDYYGGLEKTYTGWISHTCFEPRVGEQALNELIETAGDNLIILRNTKLVSVIKEHNVIKGAVFQTLQGGEGGTAKVAGNTGEEGEAAYVDEDRTTGNARRNEANSDAGEAGGSGLTSKQSRFGELFEIRAKITIEATEYGDLLYKAGLPFRFGRESTHETGEPSAPNQPDDIVQDLTYCAILKKSPGNTKITPASKNYDPERFINSTAIHSDTTDEKELNHKLHDWESFISYAALPGDKYLLNWPFRANDYPTTRDIYDDENKREEHLQKAKELTLDYIHYIQTKLGHPEWVLDDSAYDTPDGLPPIPYVREARRGIGLRTMTEWDVVPDENTLRPYLVTDSIAVGDYFLDHHHSAFFKPEGERLVEDLPDNAPFQIPVGCLIPAGVDGLLLAEKSISVTHIVNGCTRLQPVVMLIGQAAGALAAHAIRHNQRPADVPVEKVQNALLKSGCQLFPYTDLWGDDPMFVKIQKYALLGFYVVKDDFSFQKDEPLEEGEIEAWLESFANDEEEMSGFVEELRGKPRYALFDFIDELLEKEEANG